MKIYRNIKWLSIGKKVVGLCVIAYMVFLLAGNCIAAESPDKNSSGDDPRFEYELLLVAEQLLRDNPPMPVDYYGKLIEEYRLSNLD